MNNDTQLQKQLESLGLRSDEATLYLTLLQRPATHLQLSRHTGIPRTKVYRLIEQLQERSLVSRGSGERGDILVASEPSALQVALIASEVKLRQQYALLTKILPTLNSLQITETDNFAVKTYTGLEGFKQMCWHELKAKQLLVAFGYRTIDELTSSYRWAEAYRRRVGEAGYQIQELANNIDATDLKFIRRLPYHNYECRKISQDILPLTTHIVVYNDIVAMYNNSGDRHLGVEIINSGLANMLAIVFASFWELATPVSRTSNE